MPVQKPDFQPDDAEKLHATWLGHACYLVEWPSGLRVLFDPVFEDRCSPFNFGGFKRFTPPPCDLADLPSLDAVVISHSHYDHLSHKSVLTIQRNNPGAHFFVGLGLAKWFKASGLHNVTEMDWWEDTELTTTHTTADDKVAPVTAKISCLPVQHCSGRGVRDQDTTLWCSWAVASGTKNVWFGGDTGYRSVPRLPDGGENYPPELLDTLPICPQFKQIGDLRGPFDLGLIPIGAYGPRHLFSHMHANPHDAVEIFRETRCRRALGIHWGTWALTYEAVGEPPMLLKEALKKRGIPEEGVFDVCHIGESREV